MAFEWCMLKLELSDESSELLSPWLLVLVVLRMVTLEVRLTESGAGVVLVLLYLRCNLTELLGQCFNIF